MLLRKVGTVDLEDLKAIGVQTFEETFAKVNSPENMTEYISSAFAEEKLIAELSDPNSVFYFVEASGCIMGYLKVNFNEAQTELKASNALEIERIYVLQEFHGKKVGQMLFDKALDIARNMGLEVVWLGVWEKNTRAISFYEKNGFTVFDKHIFRLGHEDQTDLMMRLKL